ncbi:MAG: hypothetical protein IT359_01180 [Gemmatimonadaceae bacterium]|nr:hypothetical protein [Gemmatimonadaceae bacterium]
MIGYDVAQRMHELGVLVAPGAQAQDLLRLIVRQGMVLTAIGVALGAAIALAAGAQVQPLLFDQPARDPRM